MDDNVVKVYQAQLIEDDQMITLEEFCSICHTVPDDILEMTHEGILEHFFHEEQEWRFSFRSVERYRKADRLKKDLDLDLAGVAIVMQLLDRIEELETIIKLRS